MKPEIGKWYNIEYGKKRNKRAYHGKAKCMAKDKNGRQICHLFRKPNQPENDSKIAFMIFYEKDVKSETTSEPTYEELVERIRKYEEADDVQDVR